MFKLSTKHKIPESPVSSNITNKIRKKFLCGESAYCERNYFTIDDIDLSIVEKIS